VAGILASSILASLLIPGNDPSAKEGHGEGGASPTDGPADPDAREPDREHRAA
jgi:hypothetical protein